MSFASVLRKLQGRPIDEPDATQGRPRLNAEGGVGVALGSPISEIGGRLLSPRPVEAPAPAPLPDTPVAPAMAANNNVLPFRAPDAPVAAPTMADRYLATAVPDDGSTAQPDNVLRPRVADAPVGNPNPMSESERLDARAAHDRALISDPTLKNDPDNHIPLWKRMLEGAGLGLQEANQAVQSANASGQRMSGAQAAAIVASGIGSGAAFPKGVADLRHRRDLANIQEQRGQIDQEQAGRDAETSRILGQRKTQADIDKTNAETSLLPKKYDQAAQRQAATTAQATYKAILGRGQGFDPAHNPEHKRVADALDAAGVPWSSLDPDVRGVRFVQDATTGQWTTIGTKKDGTDFVVDPGVKTESQGHANRTFQGQQNDLNRSLRDSIAKMNVASREKIAARNAQIATDRVNLSADEFTKQHPLAGQTKTQQQIIDKATTLAGPQVKGETAEQYARRLTQMVNHVHAETLKQGATVPDE